MSISPTFREVDKTHNRARISGSEFDKALLGNKCWLESADRSRTELAVSRWTRDPSEGDQLLINRCTGPTLDVGCGPGRLVAALTSKGIACLGVDSSATAVDLTRKRGGLALRRDVFAQLPGEGRWKHVLLADGNVGIGGDPAMLLRRIRRLIRHDGSILLEVDPPGQGIRREKVRLTTIHHQPGSWFNWSWLGMDALADVAKSVQLEISWATRHGARWFAELMIR
jgi:SAM-dependent methyltransferase